MSDPIRRRSLNSDEDVVATPEGDNEYPTDIPLGPVEGLQVAGGNAPLAYDADKRNHSHADPQDADHPSGTDRVANDRAEHDDHRHGDASKGEVEETVDKLSLGQILT